MCLDRGRSAAAAENVGRFLDLIALSWVRVGTDARLRKCSVPIGRGGEARMASFHDVAAVLGLVTRVKLAAANLAEGRHPTISGRRVSSAGRSASAYPWDFMGVPTSSSTSSSGNDRPSSSPGSVVLSTV